MTLKELAKRKLDEYLKGHIDAIISGSAKDFADYKRMVGVIAGATAMYREMENILEQSDDTSDDLAA